MASLRTSLLAEGVWQQMDWAKDNTRLDVTGGWQGRALGHPFFWTGDFTGSMYKLEDGSLYTKSIMRITFTGGEDESIYTDTVTCAYNKQD